MEAEVYGLGPPIEAHMSGTSDTGTMTKDRDADSGKFREVYPLPVVRAAVGTIDEATTRAVAEQLDCSYQTAYAKLRELEDAGEITSRTIGNVKLWSVIDERPEGDGS